MATMPVPLPARQTGPHVHDWFGSEAGQAILGSEEDVVLHALGDRPGLPWLWLGPLPRALPEGAGRGLYLHPAGEGRWSGPVACGLPLPLPSESFGSVVLQHVARPAGECGTPLLGGRAAAGERRPAVAAGAQPARALPLAVARQRFQRLEPVHGGGAARGRAGARPVSQGQVRLGRCSPRRCRSGAPGARPICCARRSGRSPDPGARAGGVDGQGQHKKW